MRPSIESCKKVQLCRLVDVSMLVREPGHTIDYYLENARAIQTGHAVAMFIATPLPPHPDLFATYLRAIHETVFGIGAPSISGRFRQEGERAFFGGREPHLLEGAPAEEIPSQLHKLARNLPVDALVTMDREQFAEQCAVFLEKLFLIHPFVDGNGRVGRLVVDSMARFHSWGLAFKEFDTTSRGRRRYVRSLQFAHRYAPGSVHTGYRPIADPMKHLRGFLLRHLIQKPVELVDEPFDDYTWNSLSPDEPEEGEQES